MKYLLFPVIFLFLFSCAGVQKETIKAPDLKGLSGFFTTFENDMKNSTGIIAKQDLVKSLTHLLRMDSGGTKYYPLERDALTKMINELASYQYSECILLNKSGVIIYSMYEDDMLSKKADFYPQSIGIIHSNIKDTDGYLLDDLAVLGKEGKKALLFGMKINTAEGFQGILIAGIEIEKIIGYAAIKETIINNAGKIILDSNPGNLSKQFLEVPGLSAKIKKETFSYRNISWDILQ